MPSEVPPPPPPGRPPSEPTEQATAPQEALPFIEPRRLHPASIVLGIPVLQLAQALIFPVFAGLAAGGGRITLVILGVMTVVGLISRMLVWQRFRFSFDGSVLRVDSGVLSRNHRSLDIGRIQQVEIQRGPIQRLVGLAMLRVETAGGVNEPQVDLRVLPYDDAVALRTAVRVSKARLSTAPGEVGNDATDAVAPSERKILRVPLRHIVIASVTGARLLVLPAVIGAGLQFIGQQMGTVIDNWLERVIDGVDSIDELIAEPDWTLIAAAAVFTVLLAAVFAMVVGVVRDGDFRIAQVDDDLTITRGLLTTRESVVPLRRVQLVEIQRNWIRRLLGYSSVRIRSAGGSAGGDGRVTVPLLRDDAVDALLAEILPGVPRVPPLTTHPPAALRRSLMRWLRVPVLLSAAAWLLPMYVAVLDHGLMPWVRGFVTVLIPLNVILAVVEYRHLAHGLTNRIVVARQGAFSITTSLAPVVKIQAVSSQQNPFQRRLGLTTLHAHVAGPGALLEILDADADDAARLHAQLTRHAAAPVSTTDLDELPQTAPLAGGEPEPT